MKRQSTDCQNLWEFFPKQVDVMRSGIIFVSLFFFASRNKANSFPEEERWNLLSLLSTQKLKKNGTHKKTEHQNCY